jgi:hypothetical protein
MRHVHQSECNVVLDSELDSWERKKKMMHND